jgi:pilus assembly protein Flp/PilA
MANATREDAVMTKLTRGILSRSRRQESGQAMVEYALLLGLIAVAAIGPLTSLGSELSHVFTSIANALTNAL